MCAFCSPSPVLLLGNVDMTIFDQGPKFRDGRVVSWREHGFLKSSWNRTMTLALDCKLMDLYEREEYTPILFKSLSFFLLTEEPDPTEIFPIAPKLTPGPTANNKRSSRELLTFRAGLILSSHLLVNSQQNWSNHKEYKEALGKGR